LYVLTSLFIFLRCLFKIVVPPKPGTSPMAGLRPEITGCKSKP
jgi:hypothetical protein